MYALKSSLECFRPFQVPFDDFVGQVAMLVWIAAQSAHPELAVGLQGAHDSASLLSRRAHHGDEFLVACCRAHRIPLCLLVSRPRSPVNTEGGGAPGAQGARRAHTGSMQPTSNAAPRDAAPAECNRTSGTRHEFRLRVAGAATQAPMPASVHITRTGP